MARCDCVEVALGDGRAPAWRVVMVQPGWDAARLAEHGLLVLGARRGRAAAAWSVRRRLARVASVAELERGERLLLTPDGAAPVAYSVAACGSNTEGQLGLVAGGSVRCPELVVSLQLARVRLVACGAHHSCCVTVEGHLVTFGEASHGRLGHSAAGSPRRVELPGCARAVGVACGRSFTMVIATAAAAGAAADQGAGVEEGALAGTTAGATAGAAAGAPVGADAGVLADAAAGAGFVAALQLGSEDERGAGTLPAGALYCFAPSSLSFSNAEFR